MSHRKHKAVSTVIRSIVGYLAIRVKWILIEKKTKVNTYEKWVVKDEYTMKGRRLNQYDENKLWPIVIFGHFIK